MFKFIGRLLGFTEPIVEEKRDLVVPLLKRNIIERDVEIVNVNIVRYDPATERLEEQALLAMHPFLSTYGANAEVATASEESAYQEWRRNSERTQKLMNRIYPSNRE